MNATTRKSSRLANKPTPRYKETRDRKSRIEDDGAAEADEGPRGEDNEANEVTSTSEGTEGLSPERHLSLTQTTQKVEEITTRSTNGLLETSSSLGVLFPECVRNRYDEDKFFIPIMENPEEFTNFEVRDGLIFFKTEGVETIAVPDVQVDGQNVREILIRQGHSILAHLSDEKTITYMRDQVWWKTMVNDISDFCRSCHTCAVSKPMSGKPHGKLKTMPVPTHP